MRNQSAAENNVKISPDCLLKNNSECFLQLTTVMQNHREANSQIMKIIHISTSLMNGGLENMMVDIANEQCLMGHHVVIIVVNEKIDVTILKRLNSKIHVYLINRRPARQFVCPFIKILKVLNKLNKFDIIHAHGTYLGSWLKYITKIKTVHTVHGLNYETKPLKHYHGVYSISKAVKLDIETRSNIMPTVVYNGIKTDTIKSQSPGDNSGTFKLVQVSRLEHESKGQDILLKALNIFMVNTKEFRSKISLDFIGEGKSRKYLEELSTTLGLSNLINFVGNKPREWIYEHLADYDLFIQPSRYEGFALTVAEAMVAKLPVISAQGTGSAEVLGDGKYGFLFKNGNSEDLAKTILHVIALSQQGKLNNLIENAYRYCIANYDISITASKYIDEYKKALYA